MLCNAPSHQAALSQTLYSKLHTTHWAIYWLRYNNEEQKLWLNFRERIIDLEQPWRNTQCWMTSNSNYRPHFLWQMLNFTFLFFGNFNFKDFILAFSFNSLWQPWLWLIVFDHFDWNQSRHFVFTASTHVTNSQPTMRLVHIQRYIML